MDVNAIAIRTRTHTLSKNAAGIFCKTIKIVAERERGVWAITNDSILRALLIQLRHSIVYTICVKTDAGYSLEYA